MCVLKKKIDWELLFNMIGINKYFLICRSLIMLKIYVKKISEKRDFDWNCEVLEGSLEYMDLRKEEEEYDKNYF